MADDANQTILIRVEELAKLKRAINERDRAYDKLSQQFQMLMEQYGQLQKNLEVVMEQNSSHSATDDGSAQEEEMVVDDSIPVIHISRKKRKQSSKKRKIENHQAKAVAGEGQAQAGAGKSQAQAVAGSSLVEGCKGVKPKAPQQSNKSPLAEEAGAAKDEAAGAAASPQNGDNLSNLNSLSNSKTKSKHIPHVTCYNINIKEMSGLLEKALGHRDFTMRIMGKNATNIGVCTIVDFEKLKVFLKGQHVNYYTYTPKGQRPFSLVIGGLSGTYSTDDVRNYLDCLNIKLDILGLTELGGDRWLLRLSRESDINSFLQVRYILRCRVSMRKFKRGAITQCFNCQRFGHVSSNCEMPYRCVKCGGSHGPGKCEIPAKSENNAEMTVTDPRTGQVSRKVGLPVRCVNCNTQGHVASSKECPRRVQLVNKVQAKRAVQAPRQSPRQFTSNVVRTGVSYASAAAMASSPAAPAAAQRNANDFSLNGAFAEFDTIDNDCKRLLGGGFLNRLNKIGEFLRDYSKLNNDEAKSMALLGLLIKLRQDG